MNAFIKALHALRPGSRPGGIVISRDKSDTLLLLFACVLVLAPHSLQLPGWIGGTAAVLLAWRGWITFRGNRMPSRWLLLPLALAAMGGIYLEFRTFFGQEAGVATLVLLLTFKLLEMRARRDLFAVVFLAFFLLLARFLASQTIADAALTIVSVVVLITAQLSFQYTGAVPPLRKRLRFSATIVALAVPLTIVLFVLFPRVQGPLWAMPGQTHGARSGLSDSMSPGNISQLALSDEIAFRAKFAGDAPPQNALYWRGIVLDAYDGKTWRRDPRPRGHADRSEHRGPAVRYQITQEASRQPRLFALELPAMVPQLAGNPVRLTSDLQLATARPVNERIRYDMVSYPAAALQDDARAESMDDWLQLPANHHPRTLALAASIRARHADDAARITAVLSMFHTQPFRYTLQPPLLEGDSVDAFLFDTRAGFCEHYAGAFAVLMRAMGIPARIVTGYQGGQLNPADGFMTIRQSDAHAWAEAWLPTRGWIRVDPTAAVAPERIERSAASASRSTPVLGGLVHLEVGPDSWLRNLRFRWEALNNGWNQWVLDYTPERQKHLLRALGFDNIDWKTMTVLVALIGGLTVLLTIMFVGSGRQPADPVDRLYAAFCKRIARRGCPRHMHEGPDAYARRLLTESSLDENELLVTQTFLKLYAEYRYGYDRPSSTRTTLQSLLKRIR